MGLVKLTVAPMLPTLPEKLQLLIVRLPPPEVAIRVRLPSFWTASQKSASEEGLGTSPTGMVVVVPAAVTCSVKLALPAVPDPVPVPVPVLGAN